MFYDNSANCRPLIGYFHRQLADRHMNSCDAATSDSGQFDSFYRKKQMDVRFSCVYPVIHNEFGHNIVKVVCGSTRLSP